MAPASDPESLVPLQRKEVTVAAVEKQKYKSKIGNIRCYLHKADGTPLIFIGPDWCYFIVIMFLASGFLAINGFMVYQQLQFKQQTYIGLTASVIVISSGVFSVFRTFTGDPGIPKALYKIKEHKQKDKPKKKRSQMIWCEECKLYRDDYYDEHCEDCGVCIRAYDHHCIFYGKCIGKGNILWFNLSLAMPMLSLMVSCGSFAYTAFVLNAKH